MVATAEHSEPPTRRVLGFFLVLLVLALFRLALPYLSLPVGLLPVASFLVTAVFLVTPILAIFGVAGIGWTPRTALLWVFLGMLAHLSLVGLGRSGAFGEGFGAQAAFAFGQIGLVTWTTGLGAALALLMKDRNMLLPVALFLAGFDFMLVMTPSGPVQLIMQAAPQVFPAVAYAVPTVGSVSELAHIGPADFLFLSMFAVAMARFNMESRVALIWILPTLFAYLILVIAAGDAQIGMFSLRMLPALVPIGIVILLVNRRHFRLTRDEWLSTGFVALLVIGVIAWGMSRPRPPVEIVPTEDVPESQEWVETPGPGS